MFYLFKRIIFITAIIFTLLLAVSCVSAADNNTAEVTLEKTSPTANNDLNTFTDLQNEIKNSAEKSTLYLNGTYKYNKKIDFKLENGVAVNKDLKIIGKNDCTIDGAGLARCLLIKEGCSVTLENIKIKNGYTTTNGAGLKCGPNTKITIKNCEFTGNVADNCNGGAMQIKESSTVKIYSSVFKNNKATRTTQKSWENSKWGMGGAIKTDIGVSFKIYDSTFNSNSAYLSIILILSQKGSAKKTSTLYVNNCAFTKNKAEHNGVIYLDEYGKCTIKNSKFTKNTSPKGAGTIVVESSKSAVIKNCVFKQNKGCNGAGINVKIYKSKDTCHVKIVKCKFIKNTASMYGGAICSVGGKVSVEKCEFTQNSAGIFGGAIYARLGTLKVASSKFTKNKANYAGALCLACKKSTVKDSSITKNKAYYLYSAIYKIKHNKVTKSNVKSNKCLKYSKIYLYKSGKYIYVKVTDNADKQVKKKVKLTFKGSKKINTKWYKTSKKKYKKIKIPKSVKGTYKVSVKVKNARYFTKTITIKV